MRCSFTLILLMFVSLKSYALEVQHNVVNCEIFDMSGKIIRKFPGRICVFMDDGSLLSAEEEKLTYYNKLRNVVWSKSIHPHHQLNLSLDKKSFLVMGSETLNENNKTVRYDVLYKIDLNGNILNTFRMSEHAGEFDRKKWKAAQARKYAKIGFGEYYQKIDWEMTHVNSFYEIPDNIISKHNNAFSKGHYIANDISLMQVFILNSDLSKVIWQGPLINEEWTMFHDVQVVPGSEFILYYDNGSKLRPASRLVKLDMIKNKIGWKYPEKFLKDFYSPKMGGVQILENGNILYSDISTIPVAKEITSEGREVWSMTPRGEYADKNTREPFQQIKRMDLTLFLKNHRGL